MEVIKADVQNKTAWNEFIRHNYPPVGAFMQTWEWGEFQKALGKKAERYFLTDKNELSAAFTLVHHALPLGLSYGYAPRGPVIAAGFSQEKNLVEAFKTIKDWAQKNLSHLLFLRLEPPASPINSGLKQHGFFTPPYYIQPRFNHAVILDSEEEEILKSFHPSTRANIRKAGNRGVTVEIKSRMDADDYQQFFAMARETIQRNSGKNAYPSPPYFHALIKSVPFLSKTSDKNSLSLGAFYGYQHGEPAAAHFVLFFGDTATYLYGASFSDKLNSKVSTYLHWRAMQEAQRRGFRYYDLGGIDEKRWPTLTNFKRQFRGKEFDYMGNIDIPIRPLLYNAYNLLKKFRTT